MRYKTELFILFLGMICALVFPSMESNASVYKDSNDAGPAYTTLPSNCSASSGITWTGSAWGCSVSPSFVVTTIGSLPSCTNGTKGQFYVVTDALLPALGAIIASGGVVNVGVVCNGTNWVVI